MSIRVLVGDARAVLAGLPEASVHTCICSPPYFGLRAYGTAPQVFGEPVGGCEHVWSDELGERRSQAQQDNGPGGGVWNAVSRGQDSSANRTAFVSSMGTTCSLCNCWRGELGAEPTPDLYVAHLVEVFAAVRRVLRRDGTLWVVIGDSFASGGNGARDPARWPKQSRNAAGFRAVHAKAATGLRDKELIGIPWLFAFAMRRDGWLIRQELIWSKNSCMPESVTDRCTRAHETVFMFVRQGRYFYDAEAIKESPADSSLARIAQPTFDSQTGGPKDYANGVNPNRSARKALENFAENPSRNKRSVWTINSQPFSARDLGITETDHYAAFPAALVDPMVRAGTSERGVCGVCGAQWRRVVEREGQTPREKAYQRGWSEKAHGKGLVAQGLDYAGGHGGNLRDIQTTGWMPTCQCPPHDPIPVVCLDPFVGSGTTLMVADRLGRDAIGIELNPAYANMALKRVEADRLARDPILREQAAARAGGWTAPTLFEVAGTGEGP